MDSHRSDATPPSDSTLGFLLIAAIVVLASFVWCLALLVVGDQTGLLARAAPAMCLGGLCAAIFGVCVVDRHRRALIAHAARQQDLTTGLRHAAIRKDEFLASVSHELRTPLNVVLGYIDLLLDNSFGPLEPAQRDILHRITKNASNLSHLINDLVDLSRIEAGRMRIEMEGVDLGPLFADLTAVMDLLLAGHDVTFHAAIAPGCDQVEADPDRLKQIVSNLLVNAVKFTERGAITLTAEAGANGHIAIAVADTGIGIPRDDHQAIFEPFRQVHDRERRAPGAGIGLSISSRLAMLMGGSLGVESAPGQGARFTLVLERAVAHAADEPLPAVTLRKVS